MSFLDITSKVCLLIAGIYIGTTFIHIPYFKLDEEVNIIELGNLITIPILALLIPMLLTKNLDVKKCSKDLLISELKIFCESLSKIDLSVQQLAGRSPTTDEFRNILSNFKSARIHFSFIKEQAQGLNSSEVKMQTEYISTKLEGYWMMVTGNEGIKIKNFIASQKFIWKQSVTHTIVAREAKKLMFTINNH